jgi:hypothetical protein
MRDIFDQIEGLQPVDPKIIEAFRQEMEGRVIPEIVKVVRERERLARESRRWIIG